MSSGYYADTEAQCQVFHVCNGDGQGGMIKYSFLCPNGTVFNQNYFICDWWFNFDCASAEGLYTRNDEIRAEQEANVGAVSAADQASAANGQATYTNGKTAANGNGAHKPANGVRNNGNGQHQAPPPPPPPPAPATDVDYPEETSLAPVADESLADYATAAGEESAAAPAPAYGAPAAPAPEAGRDARFFRGGRPRAGRRLNQRPQQQQRRQGRRFQQG